jgi:glutamate formiminotransferase/glutamate formiminotransferase/formiminotetrahydrofolate cyclodeaminase
VAEAAFQTIVAATTLIDLRLHRGVHPRIGATDVVPFIPIQGVPMEECVRLARRLGARVGAELGIPVFLYEEAATQPGRAGLEAVRKGGLEGLAARMGSDPAWRPDFGPVALHETAGALVTGARRPLIAFNVNLQSNDLQIAKAIANAVRQSSGGLACLKAIGVALASRGIVQVSMNLTDYQVTSIESAFLAVRTEAEKYGASIAGSELVGLVPRAALGPHTVQAVQLERFDPMQILEDKLAAAPG